MTVEKAQQASTYIAQRANIETKLNILNNKVSEFTKVTFEGQDGNERSASLQLPFEFNTELNAALRQTAIDFLIAQKDAIEVEIGKL